eukprot:6481762-Amphidinium_carterae.1
MKACSNKTHQLLWPLEPKRERINKKGTTTIVHRAWNNTQCEIQSRVKQAASPLSRLTTAAGRAS